MDHDETRELTPNPDVDDVIAGYLKAVETGAPPNPQSLIARYPAFATELGEFFADQRGFQRLTEPIRAAVAGAPPLGTEVRYFGDYELLEEIARGGMGVVYLARQVSLNRVVALKMILAGTLASSAAVQRFRNEAEAAANLDHPNIVPIYEVGEHEGQQYFSMGLVYGGSLADRLEKSGPLPPRVAADLVKHLAEAIAFAHERGVIHRDLKPSNVLLDAQGKPKVSDFGLAKRVQKTDGPTMTGDVLGTPAYMPPEQAAGTVDLVGPSADIYSLGAILYACLTGQPPFQATSPFQTLRLVLTDEPVRPSRLKSPVPRDLENICMKCLEKNPARRYDTASALAEDLGRFLADEPVNARPTGRLRRSIAWIKKRPWVVSGITGIGLLLFACAAYGLWTEIRERGWKIQLLQARVARLSSPPDRNAALVHLKRAASIRPDALILQEAADLFAAHTGSRLVYPRDPGERNQQPLSDAATHAKNSVSMIWSREGSRLYLRGMEVDTETGRSSPLLVEGAGPAIADPSGRYLAAIGANGKIVVVARASGRRRSIDRRVDGFESLRFAPDGRSLAVLGQCEKPDDKRRLELWKTTEDAPPIQLAGAIPGHWLMSFSGDSRRVAWWCPGQQSIVVTRTRDGSTVAEPALPPNSFPLLEMVLDSSGTQVAWSEWGWLLDSIAQQVTVQDVATGAIISRLPCTGAKVMIEDLAFSPDDRFLFGNESNEAGNQLLPPATWKRNRILMWELVSGELALCLSAKGFARGSGALGELAVIRPGSNADQSQIEVCRPAELAARVADAGLRPRAHIANLGQWRRTREAFDWFGWPTLLAFIVFLVVLSSSLERFRYGQAMPAGLARVTALLGVVAVAWQMMRMLSVFDLADWSARELVLAIFCSIIPVMMGSVAVWYSVRSLISALRGDNLPVIRPVVTVEEFDRLNQRANRWLMVAWAGGLMFVFTAGIDGSLRRFGLLGILIFVGVGGFLVVSMLLVPLILIVKRSLAPAIDGLQASLARPAVALGLWSSGAVIAGTYALIGVWYRVAHRAWARFPVWTWGMDFDLLLNRDTLGSAVFAAAVVFSVAALIEVRRIATNAGANQHSHA
jgi:serine/threonine protein kinase